MATTDPKYTVLNIVRTYVTGTPITKDDNITPAIDLHLYERGPEDLKHLFYTVGCDVVFLYGEPTPVRGVRQIQDVPVHFVMSYPVIVVTVDKRSLLGTLICTASAMQAKGRTALRAAVAASAQSGAGVAASYVITVVREDGRNRWEAGLNVLSTKYIVEYTTG